MTSDWIFSAFELNDTPSQREGMAYVDELVLRRRACGFIEKLAKVLDLAKLAHMSADVYLHRFYMRHSLQRFDKYIVGAACVLLGSKAEESPVKLTSLTRAYIQLRGIVDKESGLVIQKLDPETVVKAILSMEGLVLHAMVYDLTIEHPYVYINQKVDKIVQLQHLSDTHASQVLSAKIKQAAWSFLNDSAYTWACLQMEPKVAAAGAVYLAGLYGDNVPENLMAASGASWWEVLATPIHTLQDAAKCLLAAYTDPFIKTDVLPKSLSTLVYRFHPKRCVTCTQTTAGVSKNELSCVSKATNVEKATLAKSFPKPPSDSKGESLHRRDSIFELKLEPEVEESPRDATQVPGVAHFDFEQTQCVSKYHAFTMTMKRSSRMVDSSEGIAKKLRSGY